MASFKPGRYRVQITEQGFGKAKSGNPQFIIKFDVFGFYDPAVPPPDNLFACDQGERSMFRSLTDAAVPYLAEDLRYLGYQGNTFSGVDPQEPNFHSFVGMQVDAVCKLETYDGKTREKWSLAREGSFQIDPLEKAEIRNLDALFGKVLKDTPAPMSKARKAAVAAGDGDPGVPAVETPGNAPAGAVEPAPATPAVPTPKQAAALAPPVASQRIPAVVGSAPSAAIADDDLPF